MMVMIKRTKAIMKITRSFVLILLRDTPSRGVTPTTFQPVYPTVLTVTVRSSPSTVCR